MYPTTYIDKNGATQRLPNPSLPLKESTAFNVLVTTMDSGKEQRRTKGMPKRGFDLSYKALDQYQYAALSSFFMQQGGPSRSFVWTHPDTKMSYRMRFKDPTIDSSYFGHNLQGALRSMSFSIVQVI